MVALVVCRFEGRGAGDTERGLFPLALLWGGDGVFASLLSASLVERSLWVWLFGISGLGAR